MQVASWVIVNKATGNAVLETYNRKYAEAINGECYEVVPIIEWLGRVNAKAAQSTI